MLDFLFCQACPADSNVRHADAKDESKFFQDFSAVFKKLLELGVPTQQLSKELRLTKTEDQTQAA